MEDLIEIWRPVVGYEGLYEISNLGNVKSLDRTIIRSNGKRQQCKGIILKPRLTKGYCNVTLSGKHKLIHRLVAEAFIPNPNNLPQVNHIDENKANNNVSNLEWCNASYNINYGSRNEKAASKHRGMKRSEETKEKLRDVWHNTHNPEKIRGKNNKNSIQILQYTLKNQFIKEWDCARDIERELGFNHSIILKCCKSSHKYNNYLWYIK